MPFRRGTKYKAIRAEYRGESYDSRGEAAYAESLDGQQAAGQFLFYVRQPTFKLGCPENVYRSDYMIVYPRFVVVDDVKGFETPQFKKVRKLWVKYGPCPLRVVRLKLKYPKVPEGVEPPLPTIKGIDFDVIRGGRDTRSYGPLHPEWLR